MVWIALSVTLVSIIVFPKKFAILTTIIVAGVVGIIEWQSNYRSEDNALPVDPVEVSISYDLDRCNDENRPLFITIKNNGDRIVELVKFELEGRRKGRSLNVLLPHRVTSDYILKSGDSKMVCYKIPTIDPQYGSVDEKTLDYKATSISVVFSN